MTDGGESRPRLRTALDRSRDLALHVTDAASEALRARRDPAAVAQRRYIATRRRLTAWTLGSLAAAGLATASVLKLTGGEVNAGSISTLAIAAGLFAYCAVGAVGALKDLGRRRAIVRRLPPPQPQRRPVITVLRPAMAELDAYSDALRGTIAVLDGELHPAAVRELRNETIAAADAAEVRLRARAAELSALHRAATPLTQAEIDGVVAGRMAEIRAGVAGYGRLVVAAADMAAATRALGAPAITIDPVAEVTDRLTALTDGMRAIVAGPAVADDL